MDTSPGAWRHLYEKLNLGDCSTLPGRVGRGRGWLILTPNTLSTQELVEATEARCSFKRFEDAFVCEDLPAGHAAASADSLLSSRTRPKNQGGWSGIRVRGLYAAVADRSWRGLAADMAWATINSCWHITLKEYLALWLLARSQGKRLDRFSRTICAGSSVLRPSDPLSGKPTKAEDIWIPAVGEENGVLRIERVPPKLRHGDYATRRVYKMLALSGVEIEEKFPPDPIFGKHIRGTALMC